MDLKIYQLAKLKQRDEILVFEGLANVSKVFKGFI